MINMELSPASARPQIWAIGGGKGGTGKSLVAATLGIHLSQMGRRVVLFDGDLGGPNLHTFLGLAAPSVGLADFVRRERQTLGEVAVPTGVPRLRLVSGARNPLDVESLRHFQKTRLQRAVLDLEADVVLIDLGAGTTLTVLDLFSLADRGVLVILPEPTSVENCYRFLTAAFVRRLRRLARSLGYDGVVDLVLAHRPAARARRPGEILDEIERIDAFAAEALRGHLEQFLPALVVNQVRDHADERLGGAMQAVCDRLLGIPLRFAGSIPYDPMLVRSIKSRVPFVTQYPRSRTAEALRAAGEAIGRARPGRTAEERPAPGVAISPEARALQVLDLPPGASHEQILAAYLRLRPSLRTDSPALASLDCEPERRAALEDLERAFRTLSRNLSVPAAPRRGPIPAPLTRHPGPSARFA
jgi:flagellar biosynthesis protein FlhG